MGSQKPFYNWPIPDHSYRIVRFTGECFLFGAACFAPSQFIRGFRGAPRGGGRLAAGAHAVRVNTPRDVGSFAAYSAMYCAAECAVSIARGGRNDGWNYIIGGAAAMALQNIRRGPFHGGLIGASIGAVFFGVLHTAMDWADRVMPTPSRTPIKPGSPAPVATAQIQAAPQSSESVRCIKLSPGWKGSSAEPDQ